MLIRGLVENALVHENDITGVGTGISVILDQGQGAVAVAANRNRLFADNVGLGNATGATVDANDNWWGCVAGPTSGDGYCAPAQNTGAGTIDTTRWISAVASAASPVLAPGGSTTVTGDLRGAEHRCRHRAPGILQRPRRAVQRGLRHGAAGLRRARPGLLGLDDLHGAGGRPR